MASDAEVEAQRQVVVDLRTEVNNAKIAQQTQIEANQNDVVMQQLKDEEARLRGELREVVATQVSSVPPVPDPAQDVSVDQPAIAAIQPVFVPAGPPVATPPPSDSQDAGSDADTEGK